MSWSSWLRKVFGIGSQRPTDRRSKPKRVPSARSYRLEAEGLEERLTPFSYRYFAQGGWTADTIAAAIQAELNPNTAPTIANQAFSINENVALGTSVGTVLASDPNAGQTLTYAITGGNVGNAFVINPTTGAITTASGIDFETVGTYTLTVRVTDNGGAPLSSSATVTVNVNNVNDAPVVQTATLNVNENSTSGTVVGTVAATDQDAGSVLTYSIVSGNTGNAFAINSSTGQITVVGSLDFETLATYTLIVQSTDNGTPALNGTATININVNNVNEAPTANSATFAVDENATTGTVVGTVTATDPDANSTLTYSIVAGNIGNVFAINAQTGQITVAGQLDFETVASYGLTVQVTDNGTPALIGQATITININDTNDAPVVAPATFTIAEDAINGAVVGTVTSTNVDSNQTVTYAITGGNTGNAFAIDPATGVITLVGTLDFETTASYSLIVTATDNGNPAMSGQATITVNVTNVNEAPSVTPATFTVAENTSTGTTVGTVAASDPDAGSTLTYAITAGNTGNVFAIDPATGQITVVGALDFETTPSYSLTVQVTDNGTPGLQGQATVTITITNVNEAPTVTPATFSISENAANGANVGTVSATDPDANTALTYSIVSGNTGGVFAIDPATGEITVVGTLDFETLATYMLVIQATDDGTPSLSSQATITINLTDGNDAPVVTPATFGVAENSANGTVVGTVAAVDPEGSTNLTYAITAGNTGNVFAIDPATGEITVVGSLDFETLATYTLTVSVTDDGSPATTGTATITINLTDANDAPTVTPATLTVAENASTGTVVGNVVAADQDAGDTLTYAITAGNTGNVFAIDPSTGEITVVGSLDFETTPTYSLTVQVTDDANPALSGSATITINLTNVNEAPTVTPATFSISENAANGDSVGTVSATDPDANTTLTYSIVSGNTGNVFAIDPATGEITVVGSLDFETSPQYTLVIQATDDGTPSLSSQATIMINLTDGNDAPVVTPATFGVAENSANGTVVGTVAASDPNAGQTLTYAITAGNTGNVFAIDPATGEITVVGSLDFETTPTYSLTVQVTDDANPALSATATITINLTDVNDAPTVTPATLTVAENASSGTVVGTVVAADQDAGDALTYAITAGNTGNVFAIDPATGEITVVGSLDFETTPTYSLTVQVTDDANPTLSGSATVTINITDVNETPTVTPATFVLDENVATGTVVGTVSASDPDAGQTLSYAITAGNTGSAFAINASTGEITVVGSIDFETTPTYSLTIQATDNGNPALSSTAVVTINVNDLNDVPAVSPATFAIDEDATVGDSVGTVSASDSDAGSTLTYAITAGNTGNAFAIDPATGEIIVNSALDFETVASYALTVQVTDNGNPALSNTATITINVGDVNEADPVVTAATFNVDENSANATVVGTVAASDADTAQTLTYAITAGNTGNVFAIDPATGQITVAGSLDFESTPSYSLTVTVTDNGNPTRSGQATITINLNDVNDAPTISVATFSIDENSATGTSVGTVGASDQDAGQTLTYSIIAGNTGNAFAIDPSTGEITVAGPLDFETLASYTLTVQVADDGNPSLSNTATITINLNDLNETAPVVTPATFTIDENSATGASVGTVAASDADSGQSLTYAITAGNAGNVFAIDPATGEITVAGSLDFETTPSYSLTVTVTDNGNPTLSGQATITINLNDVNDAPTVSPATLTIAEDAALGAVVGAVSASDQDAGQTLSYAITAGNTGNAFAIDPATGQITVAGALDFETLATYSLTVEVTDDGNPAKTGSATITINLTDVNDAPVVSAATFAVDENVASGTVVGAVSASDADAGQSLSYAITAGNTGNAFAIDPATGEITVVGALNFETLSSYTLTVQVMDDGVPALSNTATITINIGDVNEAPTAADATLSVDENSAVGTSVGNVAATDPDAGATLIYAITAGSTGNAFAINASTGEITVAGPLDFESIASYTLTVVVTDNGNPGLTDTATITINLNDVNDAPTISAATFSVDENSANGTVVGTVSASDADAGQTLSYAITAGNTGNVFAIDPTSGQITVVGSLDFETTPSYSLTVQVTDNGNPALSNTATITINVGDVNEADPVVTAATFNVDENSATATVVGTVAASDADTAQTITYAITAGNTGNVFAIDPATGQITVAGSLDFESVPSYSLTVSVTDNGTPTRSGQATITINLNDVNDAPTATAATLSIAEDATLGAVVGTVSASEVDAGQTLSYAITAGNTGNVFAINAATGQITVAGALDFETLATYSLTVEVTDNGNPAKTGSATITINLTDANDAPNAADATFSIDENSATGAVVGTVSASDPDAGASLSYAITGGNTGNAFAINASTGEIAVAGPLNFEGLASYTLTVVVTDNGNPGLTDTATITININDINEAPTITGATWTIDENSATGADVGTPFSGDVDAGQTLTYAITAGNAGNTFAINASTGQITVAGPINFETTSTYSLTVQVTDSGNPALSNTATITVNVNDVNEPPIASNQSFNVANAAASGTVVGTVAATDPDAGQTLAYAITAGNDNSAFALDPLTGEITVAGTINAGTQANYSLTVEIIDSGNPSLSTSITVSIAVI